MITFDDVPPIKAALRKVKRKVRRVLPAYIGWELRGDVLLVQFETLSEAVLFAKGKALPGVDYPGFERLLEEWRITCVKVIAGDKLLGKLVPK